MDQRSFVPFCQEFAHVMQRQCHASDVSVSFSWVPHAEDFAGSFTGSYRAEISFSIEVPIEVTGTELRASPEDVVKTLALRSRQVQSALLSPIEAAYTAFNNV